MKVKLTTLVAVLGAGAIVAAGCGSDDSGDSGSAGAGAQSPASTQSTPLENKGSEGKGATLAISADPSGKLAFDKTQLQAKAGNVTILMDNPSVVPHAVAIEGNGVDETGDTVQQNDKSTATADLKPGNYTFYCPVPGHKEGGMTGTLTVK